MATKNTATQEAHVLKDPIKGQEASLTINGKLYTVVDLPAYTTLNTFIREHAKLKGTKYMCREGGCGSCIVTVTITDPVDQRDRIFSVNSCLVFVYQCQGWSVTTIEHLGNRYDGYSELQERLAENNGTQCGYCTPGMIMTMYSLLQSKNIEESELTMEMIENSFSGNICRCTGYRSILDTFKSFASDAPTPTDKISTDIEDLLKISPSIKVCSKTKKQSNLQTCTCKIKETSRPQKSSIFHSLKLELEDNATWYRISAIKEIFEIFDSIDDNTYYILIHGNTAQGVYHYNEYPTVYIDVREVPELHRFEINNENLILGGNVSIADTLSFFNRVSQDHNDQFGYANSVANHLSLIANTSVRNIGSLAGNLSLKHKHTEFPSDIFLILETVGATISIQESSGQIYTLSPSDFLKMNMDKKVITNIILPGRSSSEYTYNSYKILRVSQNDRALVNAGFLFKLDRTNQCEVLEKPNIIFGGINSSFVHAMRTEEFAVGKRLLNSSELAEVLDVLSSELNPDNVLPDASPEYRKGLALSLFYKYVLSLSPEDVNPRYRSGGEMLTRPLSANGQYTFPTNESLWPLTQSVQKVEALRQCSGEAQYVNDIPNICKELYGALVLSTIAIASSFTMNTADALAMPGVVAFYSAKDIPGRNTFMVPTSLSPFEDELVFASQNILYAGQPLGMIIATTQDQARLAARKVIIEYTGVSRPTTDFLEIIRSGDNSRITALATIGPTQERQNVQFRVTGSFTLQRQYHYSMETHTCLCVPQEDGMDVYPATQWPYMVQAVVSTVLDIPQDRINVSVKRLGGAYGAKVSRSNHVAALCALAAHLSRRPVHLTLDLETNMQMMGKRFPCHTEYEVGVDNNGRIQYLNASLYQDVGLSGNDYFAVATLGNLRNMYDASTWTVTAYMVQTDTPTNIWCRAPFTGESIPTIENIMEHIARVVNRDPVSVRLINSNTSGETTITTMIADSIVSSNYATRLASIIQFNNENRWKKRGINLMNMNYYLAFPQMPHTLVAIYGNDGTVAISHGGVEMGQGINTKVIQACAYRFGIPMADITVKPTVNIISPNNNCTASSVTSERVVDAVTEACKILLERIEPVRNEMPNASWREIVRACYQRNINLNCLYRRTEQLPDYTVYGVVVTEVEIDILTGEHQVIRVDLLEDAGQCLSPRIDFGQLEGAFIMGLGYYTSEELIYDGNAGNLLTDRTWNYKVPGAKDIPVDFRIRLLQNAYNPVGVYGSKATAEPSFVLSASIYFAIRNALLSARNDAGISEEWFTFNAPATHERIWLNGMTNINQFEV